MDKSRYFLIKEKVGTIKASNYDLTSSCNLRCEGCLYFSGDDYKKHEEEHDNEKWDKFFKSESERGINFVYLAGAEPSLVPKRIKAAQKHIKRGVVFSNGSKKIDTSINYKIHISIWGAEGSSEYRGKDLNLRALKNYQNDSRALFVMTINALNINEISEVAKLCSAHNVLLTFSLFSPTIDYLKDIVTIKNWPIKSDYLRFSTEHRNLIITNELQTLISKEIALAEELYPDTLIYNWDYHNWLFSSNSLYELDGKGVAKNCGNRLTTDDRHYTVSMNKSDGKCCMPNIDCSQCRSYAPSLATYLKRMPSTKSPDFKLWLGVWEYWAMLFVNGYE
jgi:organic radical activating enzyme